MLLFIEGYPYDLDQEVNPSRVPFTIREVLREVVDIPRVKSTYRFKYVGYCYSHVAKDVVFFLPKVVLTGEQDDDKKDDTIFGATPKDIIDFEKDDLKQKFSPELHNHYKDFLSTLSIWIYRAISVYRRRHNDHVLEPDKEHHTDSKGPRQKHNSLLDVIIALLDFNRKNQDYLTFVAKNTHSGLNKIQWSKTIASGQAILQHNTPVHLNPVNRKKQVNYDEDLLIIYYSILNYLKVEHGFQFVYNLNYELISPKRLKERYIAHNYGKRRLKEIRYKYFSDRDLRIWDLCYAFFERSYEIALNLSDDFLLVTNFQEVFERMVDWLICGDNTDKIPSDLKKQKDGKRVDHLYIDKGLIENNEVNIERTYYIGDSKYYKRVEGGVKLDSTSINKQYTYARNIIQWNMNLFLGLEKSDKSEHQPQLRDDLTEGYNPIPNFFISSRIPGQEESGREFLSFNDGTIHPIVHGESLNRQFENRLFDRDTLLLSHYDINFLYLVALYGRDNKNSQSAWREKVRSLFRKEIQDKLNALYEFRVLQPKKGMDCKSFIEENFHLLNGKVFRPDKKAEYLVMAVMRGEETELYQQLMKGNAECEAIRAEGRNLKEMLESHFVVSNAFEIGKQPLMAAGDEVGTLEQVAEEKKCLLTGAVNKEDKQRSQFEEHKATLYVMRELPKNTNLMDIKYFLPMVSGKVDGYYQVIDVRIGKSGEEFNLRLKLDRYFSLGENWVGMYGVMRPGELVTIELIRQLYSKCQQ